MRLRIPEFIFWAVKYISLAHLIETAGGGASFYPWTNAGVVIGFQLAAVYFTVGILFKKFYVKKKHFLFLVFCVTGVLLCAFLTEITIDLLNFVFRDRPVGINLISVISHLIDIAIVTTIFLVIHIAIHIYKKEQANKRFEKTRLQNELDFLKSQVNPHFLFNILNSIYHLIKEDSDKAQLLLERLSQLLRYQLYKKSGDFVLLAEEFTIITHYIEIEKIRDYDNLKISLSLPANVKDLFIAPLILITFVENAFKHVSHLPHQENFIDVKGDIVGNTLTWNVSNTFNNGSRKVEPGGGMGLKNLERRLEIIYGSDYQMQIGKCENVYSIKLTLKLNETQVFGGR